jgi:hypothetical protein
MHIIENRMGTFDLKSVQIFLATKTFFAHYINYGE